MIETKPKDGAATPPAAIERLLRRSLLQLMRDTSNAQDRIDFADLADAVDASDIAGIVRNSARLRLGFAPDDTPPTDAPLASIDRAIAELKGAMELGSGARPAKAISLDPVAAITRLSRLFTAPLDKKAETELAALLEGLRMLADGPLADPRLQADGDLASAFVAHELQHFVRHTFALAYPPHGSARLLHYAARLRSGGLGPYFSTVANIVRGSEDMIGLIVLAAGDGGPAAVAQWIVPLAACVPEALLASLIDDLADLGLAAPLEGLLDVATQRTDTPAPLSRLRDAALDLGDAALAARAQAHILAAWPYNAVEWRRAGDMRATLGDSAAAQAAFAYALKLAPGDPEVAARVAALGTDAFDEYLVEAGFETSPPRQRLRLARRAA